MAKEPSSKPIVLKTEQEIKAYIKDNQLRTTNSLSMHESTDDKVTPIHFSSLPYVNPEATKGGTFKLAVRGSFDSLNPLIVKGVSGAGVRGFIYESLMARDLSKPFTLHCLICEKISIDEGRTKIIFWLRKDARFSDGTPITAQDIIFSHKILKTKGRPNHRSYYSKVKRLIKINDHGVLFDLEGAADRELPLILGLMPVLPAHAWDKKEFDQTSLEAPIGSGPYKIAHIEAGRKLIYERRNDYWGNGLWVNKGRFNFKTIQYDYYRDQNAMLEAFKSGLSNVWFETDPSKWQLLKQSSRVRDGKIILKEVPLKIPAGMTALSFNLRRAPFDDIHVRRAIAAMFNFNWLNRNLFFDQYSRNQSFFARSNLSSHGNKPTDYETRLLALYKDNIPDDIYNGTFKADDASGTAKRASARKAIKLLKQAGFKFQKGQMINEATGKPLIIEVMATQKAQERVLLAFADQMKSIGITLTIRQVDSAQYQQRKTNFDFDMIQVGWPASLSPGNEQMFRWSSKMADQKGSFNYPGIKSPAIDQMIKQMLKEKTRDQFIDTVRALDRLLLAGHYVIPLYYAPSQWIAYHSKLGLPEGQSLYGVQLDSWWVK